MTITKEIADRIYDILVAHAGASDRPGAWSPRQEFAWCVNADRGMGTIEFRFGGLLGFGGKFWNWGEKWYVTCYREDLEDHPERAEAIRKTNAALAELRESIVTITGNP
jgi:hypothetical protein